MVYFVWLFLPVFLISLLFGVLALFKTIFTCGSIIISLMIGQTIGFVITAFSETRDYWRPLEASGFLDTAHHAMMGHTFLSFASLPAIAFGAFLKALFFLSFSTPSVGIWIGNFLTLLCAFFCLQIYEAFFGRIFNS